MKILRKRYQGIIRAATVGVGVLLQIAFLMLMAELMKEYSSWFYISLKFSVFVLYFRWSMTASHISSSGLL